MPPWREGDPCHALQGERWIPFGSGLGGFADPALEERFLVKQVQAVARFFAQAFSLQVLAAMLCIVRSSGVWNSSAGGIFHSSSCLEPFCLVRGILLLATFCILRREGRDCHFPRLCLFASSIVLAIVLTTLTIESNFDEGVACGSSSNACREASDSAVCRGIARCDCASLCRESFGASVLLIHWFFGLSGLLSCIPVRFFAASLLPVLTVVLCTTADTFGWRLWSFSALAVLFASAHAERHNRFLFLVSSSLRGEQSSSYQDTKLHFDLGLEAASNLLLARLWQNAQLQSAAHELFDAVVSVDVSPDRDGKTRFAEASNQEQRRLASILVDDSCSLNEVLGRLQGSSFEDFLLPDASENWRGYVERRISEREVDYDSALGESRASTSRPLSSNMASAFMRLQLTGSRRKELLALLSPPASPGKLALLCLRSVSPGEENANCTPRRCSSVDCGIFGGGVFASGAESSTCSDPQALSPEHSDCSSCCDAEGQIMDCLPPSACVWAQGAASPTPLYDVKLGMKVLTVDPQRSPSINFDPVKKISFVAEDPVDSGDTTGEQKDRWLRIGLSDGSEVVTTASHPMWPEGTYVSSGYTLGALKAEDLVPGVDSLVSLSARRVIVKHVTTIPREAAPAGRVALELGWDTAPKEEAERSRRALFLTLPQDSGSVNGGCFIGVGDSSVKPASNRFDALEENEGDTVSLTVSTRSSTSHPSTAFGTEVVYGEGGKEDVEIILGNIDESSGWKRERATGQWVRCAEAEVLREVRLSDIRSLPKNAEGELLSFGSIGHSVKQESCKVCVFNRKNGVACRNGFSCTFCHAWHQPYVRPRRPDKRRGGRATSSAASSVDGDDLADRADPGGRADPGLGQIREEAPPREPWYVNMPAPPGVGSGGQATTGIVSGRFSA